MNVMRMEVVLVEKGVGLGEYPKARLPPCVLSKMSPDI